MSYEPKLEIYKIVLKPKSEVHRKATFRDFFRKKLDYSKLTPPIQPEDIFRTFHAHFFGQIGMSQYQKNAKKMKGFTVATTMEGGVRKSQISSPTNPSEVIHGVLNGGLYGRSRYLGEVDKTGDHTLINTNNIVSDNFYFLLYTPLDHNEGILMIQGYTEIKISDIFRQHLEQYFKNSETKCAFEYHLPQSFRDKYLKGAKFSSFTFTTGMFVQGGWDEDIPQEYDFVVKVEIIDKKAGVPLEDYEKFMMSLKSSTVHIKNEKRRLDQFQTESAKIKTPDGRSIPIDIESHDIRPVILLKNVNVSVESGHNPSFSEVNKYCHKILDEIKLTLLPENAVKEL